MAHVARPPPAGQGRTTVPGQGGGGRLNVMKRLGGGDALECLARQAIPSPPPGGEVDCRAVDQKKVHNNGFSGNLATPAREESWRSAQALWLWVMCPTPPRPPPGVPAPGWGGHKIQPGGGGITPMGVFPTNSCGREEMPEIIVSSARCGAPSRCMSTT